MKNLEHTEEESRFLSNSAGGSTPEETDRSALFGINATVDEAFHKIQNRVLAHLPSYTRDLIGKNPMERMHWTFVNMHPFEQRLAFEIETYMDTVSIETVHCLQNMGGITEDYRIRWIKKAALFQRKDILLILLKSGPFNALEMMEQILQKAADEGDHKTLRALSPFLGEFFEGAREREILRALLRRDIEVARFFFGSGIKASERCGKLAKRFIEEQNIGLLSALLQCGQLIPSDQEEIFNYANLIDQEDSANGYRKDPGIMFFADQPLPISKQIIALLKQTFVGDAQEISKVVL